MDIQEHTVDGIRIFQQGERFFMLVAGPGEMDKEGAQRAMRGPLEAARVLAALQPGMPAQQGEPGKLIVSDLHKEEYQTLRKEVETAMAELNNLEIGVLAASAAVFAWLATHRVPDTVSLSWLIPFFLVLLGSVRALAINFHLTWLGEYLQRYESKYIRPHLAGWENFLAGKELESTTEDGQPKPDFPRAVAFKEGIPRRGFRGGATITFWVSLLAATSAAGIYGVLKNPSAPDSKIGEAPAVLARDRPHPADKQP